MPKPLLKKFYFMSPVQVVKVTTHNIEQAAEWCGGVIKTTESRRNPGRTDKYIDVPVPKGAALVMAFPGMFITKRVVITLENEIKVTYGVFRKDFFEKNYWAEPLEAVDACWVRLANEEIKPEVDKTTGKSTAVLNVHVANPGQVGQALEAARQKLLENKDTVEIGEINVIAGGKEMVTEKQLPEIDGRPLTPYEQRALITEDGVEEGVVPETGNVVLPSYAQAKHPSLRQTDESEDVLGIIEHEGLRAPLSEEVASTLVGENEFDDALPEIDEIVPNSAEHLTEVLENAAEKIADGSGTIGEELNSAGIGSAARHRSFLAGEASAEGRSDLDAFADKAAYEAEMKEIEDGDPHR